MWFQYAVLGLLLLLFLALRAYQVPKAITLWLLFSACAEAFCLFLVQGGWYSYPIRPLPEIFRDNVLFNWVQYPLVVLIMLRFVRPTWFQNLMLGMTAAMYALLLEMLAKDHFGLIKYETWSPLASYFTWWGSLLFSLLVYRSLNRVRFARGAELGAFAFLRPGWFLFHLSMLSVFFYFLAQ
ncbi:hypothetical protein EV586_103277 [Tumebacillus sp. BK434]|uniref:CBO0543 family protein n=1 Tax=Tumebacillus sp. BK434 TaxID=2512169 RepID=UPI0010502449|nr:CBO0543 family protein [Tumebacillus sp. BK434]TCP55624.1 hypothetical protein EV586_103277 [Tumebacillus sp. BK434]